MAEPSVDADLRHGLLDAIHYKVKQDGMIVNKAIYMVIGIDMDGQKDVLVCG
ncbi:transposase [Desulfitobacterium dichloroeliminans]|nr:transposase [Desulfitobacterium dichloroeliminans]